MFLNEYFFSFFLSELIVNRILIVSIVVNKIFSMIKNLKYTHPLFLFNTQSKRIT